MNNRGLEMNSKNINILLKTLYLILSFWIWIYKKWIIGGSISTSQDMVLIIFFFGLSVIVVHKKPIELFSNNNNNTKYKQRVYIGTFFAALYAGFASIGSRALMLDFSIKGCLKILTMSYWWFPVLFLLNNIKNEISTRIIKSKKQDEDFDNKLGLKAFVFISFVWILLYIGVWPGALPYDGNLELDMAKGIRPLSNWQPYIHVFIVKLFLNIFGHVSGFFLFQIFLGASLIASLFYYVYKKTGCRKRIIWVLIYAITLCPAIFTTTMILLRDYLFSVGMAWLVFLLLIYDKKHISKSYYWGLLIAAILASSMRSNGIIVFFIAFINFLLQSIKYKDKYLVVVSGILFIFMLAVNGPLEKIFDVQEQTRVTFLSQPAIDAFMCVKAKGGDLPEEAEQLMEDITLLDKDSWWHNYTDDHFDMSCDVSDTSSMYILKCYILTLIKEPHLVIWNRLNKVSNMWEIFGHGEGFIKRYFFVNFINENSGYISCEYPLVVTPMTAITEWIYKITGYLGIDYVLYRGGLFVLFILNSIVFSNGRLIKKKIVATLPVLGNFIGMFYAMGYHENRYVYWLFFCWISYIILDLFIVCVKEQEE